VERAVEEVDFVLANLKSFVGTIPRKNITQWEGDASEAAAYLKDRAAAGNVSVDAQQHAPFFPPPKPLFEDVNTFLAHQVERWNKLRVVGNLVRLRWAFSKYR